MSRNNTGHDWTVRGGRPDHDDPEPRVLVARSPDGRVEIEVNQEVGTYWNARDGGHEEGVHYTVAVYESTHYNYYPKHGDGEWIDHSLTAHPRSSSSGQGWEPTYASARTLLVNAIAAIEDGKWISGSLDDSHREYVYSRMDEEEVVRELRGMFRATATDTESVTRDEALELARTHERWELATFLYGQTEDDFAWLMMDVEDAGDAVLA